MNEPVKRAFLSEDGRVRNGWKILGFLAALASLGKVTSLVAHRLGAPKGDMFGEWVSVVLMLLVSWVFVRLEREPFQSLGWKLNGRWGMELLLGTLLGVGLIGLAALGAVGSGAVSIVRSGQSATPMLSGAVFFLAVALFEEGLFRGYLFQRMTRGAGFVIAQVVMALFFGMVHWGNPGMSGATKLWATLDISLASVLLGFCWKRTGSLSLPIGVHLGWNWAQGPLLGFGVSGTDAGGFFKPVFAAGKPEWLSGGAFGLEASLTDVIICALAILVIWKWKGRSVEAGNA
ncbi:MAG TPA: CPBP family intramembrane glutamic endopeptidase [Holophagaceae bacterium]|nr:CPBP family intramembrane glutamic endopeptidase [Holophagaceae bacterium]